MIEENQTIEGTVESLAFGGKGIIKHEGFVIFVPFTAPGDVVKVNITSVKKSFAEGDVVEVITPASCRTKPTCQYYGICGGCQLQHISYESQTEQKAHFVADAIERIGKIALEEPVKCLPSSTPWHYRRSITFSIRSLLGNFGGGFVSYDNKEVISVEECPLFVKGPLLKDVHAMLHSLKGTPNRYDKVSIVKNGQGAFVLAFDFKKQFPKNLDIVMGHLLEENDSFAGAVAYFQERKKSYGVTSCSYDIEGLTISFSASAFVQTHPEQSATIYNNIVKNAKECNAENVLDLYCGIGVSTLMLAKEGMHVTGVENNREATKRAIQNSKDNDIKGAYFFRGDVSKVAEKLLAKDPDLVIINPPRTGVDDVTLSAINHAWPKNIIYISCMPATLARDVAALKHRGYKISSCKAYDMFPQTTHVETMVVLERIIGAVKK